MLTLTSVCAWFELGTKPNIIGSVRAMCRRSLLSDVLVVVMLGAVLKNAPLRLD